MGLILSSDTFEIFFSGFYLKDFRYQFRLNFGCQSNSNSAFSRNFAVMKCESKNRAHIMMKNLTRNTYVFVLR